jgi:hypothetical protein
MQGRCVSASGFAAMFFIRGLLRLLAFAFNIAVGVFLLGVGFIASLTGENIHFPLVPGVEGETLKWTLIGLGLFALTSTFLSLVPSKAVRSLMVLWNLLVIGLLICAVARSSYRFESEEHLHNGLVFSAVALLALWGAWAQMKSAQRKDATD